MRSGRSANHGGAFAAAHATDELRRRARGRAPARCSAPRPREIVFGASFTALTMAFAGAVGRTLRPRRRGRLHAPRPRRQRAAVGDPRRARRRDRALRRARAGDARAAGERGRGGAVRAHALGRGHPRLQRRRHDPRPARHRRRRPRGGRARLRRRRPRRAAPPDRRRRARLRRARVLGLQVVRPARRRPVGARASCSPSWRPTSSSPPPTRRPTAGRTGRCRSRRWPASRRRPTTRATMDWDAVRAHEEPPAGRRARGPRRAARRDPPRPRARPHADADVHRRGPDRRSRSPRRWPSARSRSGTATTTPGSSSATSASPRTARSAPASCTTTTSATSSACSTRSRRSSWPAVELAGADQPAAAAPPDEVEDQHREHERGEEARRPRGRRTAR